jgi:hypothetical protein
VTHVRVAIAEIASSVSGSKQLFPDSCLPLKEQDFMFSRSACGNRGSHSGCSGSDDGDFHGWLLSDQITLFRIINDFLRTDKSVSEKIEIGLFSGRFLCYNGTQRRRFCAIPEIQPRLEAECGRRRGGSL